MKAQLTVGVALLAWGSIGAVAAEPVTAPAYSWTGYYVGGHLGYASGQSDWSAQGPSGNFQGSFEFFRAYDVFKGTGS